MADSSSPDSPVVPVLVAKYLELEVLLAEIAEAGSSDLDDVQVNELVRVHERIARKLEFVGLDRLLEVSDRSSFVKAGYPSLFGFARKELRLSKGATGERTRAMEAVAQFHSLQGELLPPKCPAMASAWAEGAIGFAHVDAILDVRNEIPSKAGPDVFDVVDQWMTEDARVKDPTELKESGRDILARVDPDGSLTDDVDRARKRTFSKGSQGVDFMAIVTGRLDPKTYAMLETVMDVWAAPGMNNPADPDSPSGAKDDPAQDAQLIEAAAQRDTRSVGQRRHDALTAILTTILECNLLGRSHRGLPAQLIVTLTKQQLDEAAGVATTANGVDIPVKDVLELAARSDKWLAVFPDHSAQVLHLARAKRVAQLGQRLAIIARDRGCSHPGCRNPATWAEFHHVLAWIDGGLTDVDNLTPACVPHHRMIGPGKWATVMITDGPDKGRVAWIPPVYVDPEQKPRVNRAHHVNESVEAAWLEILAQRQAALRERESQLQLPPPPAQLGDDPDPPEQDQ
ncbi:HNH endonuclease signature motif containing protein [Williamsia soli]|uniref:HNH endonuclease signature motif containing protein n=1 Tax=Williamsia soli TaxID=364929 RepID=UPI001A9E4B53|nr:HNH endonuclease signature motif containing protein [Williamsia soli]